MPTSLNVLIVEDSLNDVALVVAELHKAGFAPNWKRVETEPDFLAELKKRPDIILSDYSMPQFSGLRAAQLTLESGLEIPFILISGTVGEDVAVEAMQHGATDYFLKDRLGRLGAGIERALQQKLLRDERRRAEMSANLFRTLVDRSSDGIEVINPETGRFLDVNETTCLRLGYTREELLSLSVPDIEAIAVDFSSWGKNVEEIRQAGFKVLEGRHRRKNGSTFPVEVNVRCVKLDRDYLIASVRDITERKKLEAELALREQRLNAFFTNAPAGLVLLDNHLRYVQLNETVAKINGVPLKDHLGKTVREVLPKLASVTEPLLQRVLATGEPMLNIELSGETPSQPGVLRHWMESFFPIIGKNGRPNGIGVIFVEITERKQAEEALRESEEKFSKIFQSSPMAIALSTANEGRYLDVNKEFLRILQRSREEVVGHTAVELGVWADPEQRTAMIAKFNEQGVVRNVELIIRGRFGHITPILWSADLVAIGGESCLLGSSMDITERKRAEEELRWKTAFFEAQVDSALDGILVVDSRAKKILQNQRLNDLLKIPQHISENKDDARQVQFVIGQMKNPRQFAEKVAYLYAHPDKVSRDEIELVNGTVLDRYSSPVRDKTGKYYGRIWTFRDITEQRKLEGQFRQAQKMEAFGQLAGGVAHDFNNILAIIQLQAGLLKSESNLSLEQLDFAEEIEKAARRATNLTRQLLLFSRKQTMQPRNLKLKDVVANMTKMLQRTLGEQIQLQFRFSDVPLFIHADPGMIDQILLNLTVNARDAMPKGGQIIIETAAVEFDETTSTQTAQARPGSFVSLSVTDTGCGIPPEILPRIFEPFFTTKEVGKGTGLGLATIFGIVQQHQGWINVQSEAGQGSSFRVYLPRLQTETSDTKIFRLAQTSARGGNEGILLVEDEPSLRVSLRIALTRLGYHVLEASTGSEALEVWKQNRDEIQLLLTDMVMPGGLTGKELADQLLKQNPKLKVIYASGYSAETAGKELLLEEGVNFLTKPFDSKNLAKIIRESLDQN